MSNKHSVAQWHKREQKNYSFVIYLTTRALKAIGLKEMVITGCCSSRWAHSCGVGLKLCRLTVAGIRHSRNTVVNMANFCGIIWPTSVVKCHHLITFSGA